MFHAEGQEVAKLLRRKAVDEDFAPLVERIVSKAIENGLDPAVATTDVFATAVLWVGSKSLSHVLACIDRMRIRLTELGSQSDAARGQIITSVIDYWAAHPGVALCIVEKLLNYSVLTPLSVVDWALVGAGSEHGRSLARPHIFEMVFNTVAKVTGWARLVAADVTVDPETKVADMEAVKAIFAALENILVGWADGSRVADDDEDADAIMRWGQKWLRVFRRRAAMEEAILAGSSKKGEAMDVGQ